MNGGFDFFQYWSYPPTFQPRVSRFKVVLQWSVVGPRCSYPFFFMNGDFGLLLSKLLKEIAGCKIWDFLRSNIVIFVIFIKYLMFFLELLSSSTLPFCHHFFLYVFSHLTVIITSLKWNKEIYCWYSNHFCWYF